MYKQCLYFGTDWYHGSYFSHPRASDLELGRVRRPVVLDLHRLGIAAERTTQHTNHQRGHTRMDKGQTKTTQPWMSSAKGH